MSTYGGRTYTRLAIERKKLTRGDGGASLALDATKAEEEGASLLSAVLYGRRFEDDVLPYSC